MTLINTSNGLLDSDVSRKRSTVLPYIKLHADTIYKHAHACTHIFLNCLVRKQHFLSNNKGVYFNSSYYFAKLTKPLEVAACFSRSKKWTFGFCCVSLLHKQDSLFHLTTCLLLKWERHVRIWNQVRCDKLLCVESQMMVGGGSQFQIAVEYRLWR